MTNFSFGRTDGRTERGNNNIPELSLESAGIIIPKMGKRALIAKTNLEKAHKQIPIHPDYTSIYMIC